MNVKRGVKAVLFWIVVGVVVLTGMSSLATGNYTGDRFVGALAFDAIFYLIIVTGLHRLLYGAWLPLRRFSPIRPEPAAE